MNRTSKILVGMVAAALVVSVTGASALVRHVAKDRTYSDVTRIPHRKVGVLLGCSRQLSDGRRNLFFVRRMAAATQLYKAKKVDFLIVSGDNHRAGYDEPSEMKQALVDAGIPADRLYCDYAGFRTLDSIVRAKEVFGESEITVISQKFHTERAIYIAWKNGVDAIGFNADDVDVHNSFRTRLRERFARVKTVLDVWFGTQPKFLGPPIRIGQQFGASLPRRP